MKTYSLPFLLTAIILLLTLTTGCVSEYAARRIVAAPNHERPYPNNNYLNIFVPKGTKSPFTTRIIPVGPPEAKIKIAELPPGDYQLKFKTETGRTRTGKRYLNMNSVTNVASFTPVQEPATIVILHSYLTCKETMTPWAYILAEAGYRVILLDLRGHGQSTGSQVTFGKYETIDLAQILDSLIAQHLCDDKVGVLGFSYGATLALHWAARDPRIQTVVAIAPYNHPDEAIERLTREFKMPISRKTARKALDLASAKLDINWSDWSGEKSICQIKHPVLLIGGGKDTISRPDDLTTLKQAACAGTETLQLPKADHLAIGFWFQELDQPVRAWFHHHLSAPCDPKP